MTSACKYRLHKQWFCIVVSHFSENDHRKTRCFQHRGVKTRGVLTTWFLVFSTLPAIFNTFSYCIPVRFFSEIQHLEWSEKRGPQYCIPAPNTQQAEGFDESDAFSAGIQGFNTHASRWNQVKMCVQINFFPSTSCVFRAGTHYFLTENRGITGTKFQWKKYWISVRKNVENSWECWQIRKTGGQNTSRFDTSVLKAACFTIVIFWKVRHYEAKSLFFSKQHH